MNDDDYLADEVLVECRHCQARQTFKVILKSVAELQQFLRVTFPPPMGFVCPACGEHDERINVALHCPDEIVELLRTKTEGN